MTVRFKGNVGMNMNVKRSMQAVLALSLAGALAGCTGGNIVASAQGTPAPAGGSSFVPDADAGVPVAPISVPADELAKLKTFSSRTNPFALLAEERSWESKQKSANIFNRIGGFTFYYEEPPKVEEVIEYEEQPYRRLAGVMIGESVQALIDMGDGRLRRIRPGMEIEGTDWMVASIDEDKAVLRRVKASRNKRPYEVVVPLESNARGSGGGGTGGGGGAGNPGGRTGGGSPAGRPGEFDDR